MRLNGFFGIWTHWFPVKLRGLRCPVLNLFQVLLPDGVENPVIIGSIASSGCLAIWLPTMKQDFRIGVDRFYFRVDISTSGRPTTELGGENGLLIGLIRAGFITRPLRFPLLVPVDQLRQIGRLFGMPYNIPMF